MSHLILKEWLEEKVIHNITFDTTFHVQIHGLPPILLNEDSIGNQIGVLHANAVNQKCFVGDRFIHIKVDIAVNSLISAGFFQTRKER